MAEIQFVMAFENSTHSHYHFYAIAVFVQYPHDLMVELEWKIGLKFLIVNRIARLTFYALLFELTNILGAIWI